MLDAPDFEQQVIRVFIDRDGREVSPSTPDAIELRCAGAGWRWHDFDGREWGSAGGTLRGEMLPRWVVRTRDVDAIMEAVHPANRYRWCESTACSCLGCVNNTNPVRLSKREWQDWVQRHPKPVLTETVDTPWKP